MHPEAVFVKRKQESRNEHAGVAVVARQFAVCSQASHCTARDIRDNVRGGLACPFEMQGIGQADKAEITGLTVSDGDDDNGDRSGSAYVFSRFEPVAWAYLPVVLRSAP